MEIDEDQLHLWELSISLIRKQLEEIEVEIARLLHSSRGKAK